MPTVTIPSGDTKELISGNRGEVFYVSVETGEIRVGPGPAMARLGRRLTPDDRGEFTLKESGEAVYGTTVSTDDADVLIERQGFEISLFNREITRVKNATQTRVSTEERPDLESKDLDDVIFSEPAAGESDTASFTPENGELWRIDTMDLHAPGIAGSTGTHSFQIKNNFGTEILFGESEGPDDLRWINSHWKRANVDRRPASREGINWALETYVAEGEPDGLPIPMEVTYSNDTDTDQTGSVTIDLIVRVTHINV